VPGSSTSGAAAGWAPATAEGSGRLEKILAEVKLAWDHPANQGQLAGAMRRVVGYRLRKALSLPASYPLGQHSRIRADARFPSTEAAVRGNPPDWAYMVAWRRFLGPGTLFVDVGANAGVYSLWARDLGAEVVAVEPDPAACEALRRNAALNGYRIEIVAAALDDRAGTGRLTQGLGPKNHLVASPEEPGSPVAVRTLDDVLGERVADGVKLDVEGAERRVLAGAPAALAEGRLRVIQMEYNHQSATYFGEDRFGLRDLLADHGYRFYRPDDEGNLQPVRIGSGGGRDVFATREAL
jgi:FkbM family methyltransferase